MIERPHATVLSKMHQRCDLDGRVLFPVFNHELLGMPILLFDILHVARIEIGRMLRRPVLIRNPAQTCTKRTVSPRRAKLPS